VRIAHRLLALAAASALVLASCFVDPVHDDEVSALGDESPNVPKGPLHRAGQPCVLCHGGSGPASAQFSVAGTVFKLGGSTDPAVGASVQLTDSKGNKVTATTNAAGNFYVSVSTFSPTYPLVPFVSFPGIDPNDPNCSTQMHTHVGRDGSCAGCHTNPMGPRSPGRIFIAADPSCLPH
jgi:hypothetical protein